jgi:hypothetical protein
VLDVLLFLSVSWGLWVMVSKKRKKRVTVNNEDQRFAKIERGGGNLSVYL